MRSTVLSAESLASLIQSPPIRGFDYLQWDCVAGDPYPFILTTATFDGVAGKPVIQLPQTAGSTAVGRFLPYKGSNNNDGAFHLITVTAFFYISGTGTFGHILSIDSGVGGTNTNINKTAGNWSIGDGVNTSPALALDTWYRITKRYIPGVSCETYIALETDTTDTLIGTRVTPTFTTTAPAILLFRNAAGGTALCNMANVKVLWSTA